MRFQVSFLTALALLAGAPASTVAFTPLKTSSSTATAAAQSSSTSLYSNSIDRRSFGDMIAGIAATSIFSAATNTSPANAQVFFDPAQYGDQELRVGAVDSVKETVRRSILKNPKLAPSFYQLSLLDALSYNAKTNEYGPDGSIMISVLSSKATDEYTKNLQAAALALVEAEQTLRRKTAISLADAVAIGGSEAIESVGGPVLPVQLGRADTPKSVKLNPNLPIDLFSGNRPNRDVVAAFQEAGMTDREMTALLSGMLTLEKVEKERTVDDWKMSAKPKFREAGKMGRMSEFRPITEEDIAQAALEEDPEYEDPDDGWYIADSFGTKDDRFGDRLGKDKISEKTFNKYLKEVSALAKKKDADVSEYGWIASLLLDPDMTTSQTWMNKYAGSNLTYLKDLGIAFNSLTQLGAVYTGGKYENLLKNRPRKSLNDDDLKLF